MGGRRSCSPFPDNRSSDGSANDPAILSDKDWFIGAGANGRWQWNAGDGTDRADYDGPASQLSYGQWHHLCVVHDRTTNEARLYYDASQPTAQVPVACLWQVRLQ